MSADVPTLAVWKFSSCDGCQLSLLDCEDELLAVAGRVRIAHFLEASRAVLPGPYDVSLVEGSVTTEEEAERVQTVRANSKVLVTIGACATSGGVQALRNPVTASRAGGLRHDVDEFRSVVYPKPEFVHSLATVTPIAAHVKVDLELRGCPVDRRQLLEVVGSLLVGRRPNLPAHSVCFDCKQRGNVCVVVARGTPCLGPVTHAGCGAICPAVDRGCFGCFGPMDTPNPTAQVRLLRGTGMSEVDIERVARTFNTAAPAFAELAATAGEKR